MQPDFEALARAAHAAIHSGGHVTAAQVLREAFEAQLAEVRAEQAPPVRGLIDRVDRQEAALAYRDHTITALQAREAEHLATIERLREALGKIESLPRHSREDAAENQHMMQIIARTALNGESDHG